MLAKVSRIWANKYPKVKHLVWMLIYASHSFYDVGNDTYLQCLPFLLWPAYLPGLQQAWLKVLECWVSLRFHWTWTQDFSGAKLVFCLTHHTLFQRPQRHVLESQQTDMLTPCTGLLFSLLFLPAALQVLCIISHSCERNSAKNFPESKTTGTFLCSGTWAWLHG